VRGWGGEGRTWAQGTWVKDRLPSREDVEEVIPDELNLEPGQRSALNVPWRSAVCGTLAPCQPIGAGPW